MSLLKAKKYISQDEERLSDFTNRLFNVRPETILQKLLKNTKKQLKISKVELKAIKLKLKKFKMKCMK